MQLRITAYQQLPRVKWTSLDLKYRLLMLSAVITSIIPLRFGYFLAEYVGEALFILFSQKRNIIGNNIEANAITP